MRVSANDLLNHPNVVLIDVLSTQSRFLCDITQKSQAELLCKRCEQRLVFFICGDVQHLRHRWIEQVLGVLPDLIGW
jgi:hypothetical protein